MGVYSLPCDILLTLKPNQLLDATKNKGKQDAWLHMRAHIPYNFSLNTPVTASTKMVLEPSSKSLSALNSYAKQIAVVCILQKLLNNNL